jgi:hypothetical protein
VQQNVVGSDAVAAAALGPVQGPLELGILERLDLPAIVADEMVVMIAAREETLEASSAPTELDPLQETPFRQEVEGAIDAGEPNPPPPRAQLIEDLERC